MKYIVCLKVAAKILAIGICFVVLLSGLSYTNQDALAHFTPPEKGDMCPVCNMPVSDHPLWVAVIMFSDGEHVKLHGPKSMFTYYFNLGEYSNKYREKDIATIHVKDYSTHEHISAKKAYYVIHSNIEGLKGDELIPFSDRVSAETYTKKHGGKILSFKEITPDIIASLKDTISDDYSTGQRYQ